LRSCTHWTTLCRHDHPCILRLACRPVSRRKAHIPRHVPRALRNSDLCTSCVASMHMCKCLERVRQLCLFAGLLMHPVLGAVNAHGAVWERRVSDPIALPKCARMRVWWQHGSWEGCGRGAAWIQRHLKVCREEGSSHLPNENALCN
jgi:hypothetical protein